MQSEIIQFVNIFRLDKQKLIDELVNLYPSESSELLNLLANKLTTHKIAAILKVKQ